MSDADAERDADTGAAGADDPDADAEAATVTVYSREECHLCEEALDTVRRVASDVARPVDVETVDVDDDPDLREVYGERVPYVLVDGRPAFKFRVDAAELRERLDA